MGAALGLGWFMDLCLKHWLGAGRRAGGGGSKERKMRRKALVRGWGPRKMTLPQDQL